jgi:hypothetical protein
MPSRRAKSARDRYSPSTKQPAGMRRNAGSESRLLGAVGRHEASVEHARIFLVIEIANFLLNFAPGAGYCFERGSLDAERM